MAARPHRGKARRRRPAPVGPVESSGAGAASDATSRLALVDALLASKGLVEASRIGVEWIGGHTDAAHVVIALVDRDGAGGPRLVGAAGYGLATDLERLSIDLEASDHPLVASLSAPRPVVLSPSALASIGLGSSSPCTAWPLPISHNPAPVALVLVGATSNEAELRWALDVLGHRLVALRSHEDLAATKERLDGERALLETILRTVPDPVLLTDSEGRLVLANPRGQLYLVSNENETEGRRRTIGQNNQVFSAALSRHAAKDTAPRELPLVDPSDGSDRLFELKSTPIATPAGHATLSVLRNVTELQSAAREIEDNYDKLRVAEAEARAERDRLDLIIDSVADPILVTDANGVMTMTNAPAERLFNAPADAPAEEALRVRANDTHFSSHVANLFLLEGARLRGELGLVDPKTATPVPVEAISGKIVSERGEVTAIVTILHDLTEQMEKNALYEELKKASSLLEDKVRDATAELVRRNELLQRQALELEAASSAKSQFLANMSHEFRTPLNAILGYTSMMLQGVLGPLPSELVRPLSRIDSNGRHLLTIITDVLDIVRVEAGRMPLDVRKFSPGDVVTEVLSELEPIIARSGLVVRSRIDARVPPLRSDRTKVKQIVMNLVANALKFTPKGSVVVSVHYAPTRSQVSISVADTGIGISDADQATVFQAFRQVDDSPTRPYGGTGLGLAICHRLAIMLGGELRLTSQLGKGSTFRLVLPTKSPPKGAAR